MLISLIQHLANTSIRSSLVTGGRYDLTQIVGGAEGTLGVIVELTLRVFPLPQARVGGLSAFPSGEWLTVGP